MEQPSLFMHQGAVSEWPAGRSLPPAPCYGYGHLQHLMLAGTFHLRKYFGPFLRAQAAARLAFISC